jgi:hypothetical protein
MQVLKTNQAAFLSTYLQSRFLNYILGSKSVQAECVTDSGTLKCLCKDGYYVNSVGGCTASKLSFFTKTIIYKVNICYSNE